MSQHPALHALTEKVSHDVGCVLLSEVVAESCEGLRTGKGAIITTASYHMVGIFPKETTHKASTIMFVVKYLLPACCWKEVVHQF